MEQMPEEKGFDPEPPKEKRDIVPHLTLPVEATNVDENRPLTTGIRRSISNLRRESMNDLNSTRRAQLTLYDEFMDAKTPRDWLQRSERQKNKDMSNLAEVYARKDLERIAKKLDSIDRQLISAVSDSKERAHIARAKFERREKHIEKELEIRRVISYRLVIHMSVLQKSACVYTLCVHSLIPLLHFPDHFDGHCRTVK
eukprot:TRINITY_DN4084_c0_g1_i13.p1 TRINITY_DN4084_c0_g1~~TRINITY_DN4084_c0_g1_i13.p1  ORF type:complete len:199 (+),score=35.66 TRINITY_DN4084_c0_g1_i13:53-649(+)